MIGCSTAGELDGDGPGDAGVVVAALGGSGFDVAHRGRRGRLQARRATPARAPPAAATGAQRRLRAGAAAPHRRVRRQPAGRRARRLRVGRRGRAARRRLRGRRPQDGPHPPVPRRPRADRRRRRRRDHLRRAASASACATAGAGSASRWWSRAARTTACFALDGRPALDAYLDRLDAPDGGAHRPGRLHPLRPRASARAQPPRRARPDPLRQPGQLRGPLDSLRRRGPPGRAGLVHGGRHSFEHRRRRRRVPGRDRRPGRSAHRAGRLRLHRPPAFLGDDGIADEVGRMSRIAERRAAERASTPTERSHGRMASAGSTTRRSSSSRSANADRELVDPAARRVPRARFLVRGRAVRGARRRRAGGRGAGGRGRRDRPRRRPSSRPSASRPARRPRPRWSRSPSDSPGGAELPGSAPAARPRCRSRTTAEPR